MTENPYIFDTFKLNDNNNNSTLTTCRLEYGNGTFYPEYAYESDPKKLNLKYTMTAPAADVQFHAVVLYEEDIVIDKVGDQLLIV